MKINIILPVNNPRILSTESIEQLHLPKEITCKITLPKNNLLEITSAEEERIATPSIVEAVIASEKNGFDAAIVYCFGEPGVLESRAKVSMPVFGIASPSMHVAAQLGNYFSVIASLQSHCPLIDKLANQFGLSSKMKPAKSIDISPDKLIDSDELLFSRVLDIAKQSIENDQVDTFVLGCGSMQSKGEKMRQLIKENYGYDVMIVDPLPTTLYFVSSIVNSKLSHSKQAYL